MKRLLTGLFAVALVLGLVGSDAFAQQQKAAPKADTKGAAKGAAPKPGDKFGEWTYQCDELAKDAPKDAKPNCYLSQARMNVNEQGAQNRVLLVNLTKAGTERQPLLFVFLPFGVALQQDVSIFVDESQTGLKSRADTCLITGCRVPFLLQADMLDTMRKGKTLWVSFLPLGGNGVRVEVPLSGFTAGLAALN